MMIKYLKQLLLNFLASKLIGTYAVKTHCMYYHQIYFNLHCHEGIHTAVDNRYLIYVCYFHSFLLQSYIFGKFDIG